MRKMTVFPIRVALLVSLALAGCATASRTSTTETITTQTTADTAAIEGNRGNFPGGDSAVQPQSAEPVVVKKEVRVSEERVAGEPRGIVGTTFHFIGQVLAFPFKLIAGVIEVIF